MQKWIRLFLITWIITLPFSKRILVWQAIPGWHEYESLQFYLSDFFLWGFIILSLGWLIRKKIYITSGGKILGWLILLDLVAGLTIFWSESQILAFGKWLRLDIYMGLAWLIFLLGQKKIIKRDLILWSIAGAVTLQAIIALLQFKAQSSLGLEWLGEPILHLGVGGVSFIPVGGTLLMRAYGTFLHPNILATWLIVGWWSWLYLYNQNNNWLKKIIYLVFIYITGLALVVTFSRAAWLVWILVTITGLAVALIKNNKKWLATMVISIFIIGASFIPLTPLLKERLIIKNNEPAVTDRISYNNLGIKLLQKNPFGVGIGNQVLATQKNGLYKESGLNNFWEWQPIHNIYLLNLAELGWIGGIIFIGITLKVWWLYFKNQWKEITYPLFYIITSLMILGLFDHHLLTIATSQGLWWLAVGLSLKNK